MKNAIISILFIIALSSCGKMSGERANNMPIVNDLNSKQKPWLVFTSGLAKDGTKHFYYHKADSMRWIAVKDGQIIRDKKWVSK